MIPRRSNSCFPVQRHGRAPRVPLRAAGRHRGRPDGHGESELLQLSVSNHHWWVVTSCLLARFPQRSSCVWNSGCGTGLWCEEPARPRSASTSLRTKVRGRPYPGTQLQWGVGERQHTRLLFLPWTGSMCTKEFSYQEQKLQRLCVAEQCQCMAGERRF